MILDRTEVPAELAAVATVERVFRETEVRMRGLEVCNPALQVEAIGFRPWQGVLVGVLVAPWTVSLLIVEASSEVRLRRLALDEQQRWRFPSGDYEFCGRGGNDDSVGAWQSCSLFSPPSELRDQEEARAVAREVLSALFLPVEEPGQPHKQVPATPSPPPPTRRAFLTLGRAR